MKINALLYHGITTVIFTIMCIAIPSAGGSITSPVICILLITWLLISSYTHTSKLGRIFLVELKSTTFIILRLLG